MAPRNSVSSLNLAARRCFFADCMRPNDDFYIPNRAQLILDFLRKHGDRLVKERNGPKQSFPNTLALVQHVMDSSKMRSQD